MEKNGGRRRGRMEGMEGVARLPGGVQDEEEEEEEEEPHLLFQKRG